MSVDSFFFVFDDKMPTLQEWQTALDQARTEIVLADVGDLRTHAGYLPATHRGHPSGFEWYYGSIAENFGTNAPHGVDGREHVINCVTHSEMRELACGLAACSVLAQLVDGKFLDEESGNLVDPAVALAEAVAAEREI